MWIPSLLYLWIILISRYSSEFPLKPFYTSFYKPSYIRTVGMLQFGKLSINIFLYKYWRLQVEYECFTQYFSHSVMYYCVRTFFTTSCVVWWYSFKCDVAFLCISCVLLVFFSFMSCVVVLLHSVFHWILLFFIFSFFSFSVSYFCVPSFTLVFNWLFLPVRFRKKEETVARRTSYKHHRQR